MRSSLLIMLTLALSGLTMFGCDDSDSGEAQENQEQRDTSGDAEDSSTADDSRDDDQPGDDDLLHHEPIGHYNERPGRGDADGGFELEPWPIGDRWYQYDDITHAVLLADRVFLLNTDDGALLFRALGYYGTSGDAGFLSVEWRTFTDGEWSDAQERMFDQNVKDGPICLDIFMNSIDCLDERVGMVFRIEARVLTVAGFVIGNPGIYEAGHPAGRNAVLISLEEDLFANLPEDPTKVAPPRSPARNESDWVIGAGWNEPEGRTWLHATTSMHLVHWRMSPVEGYEASERVLFHALCVPLKNSASSHVPFSEGELYTREIDLSDNELSTSIRLCDDIAEVDQFDYYAHGNWPDSYTYDLLLERHGDELWVRAAAGSLVYPWPADDAPESGLPQDVTPPSSLWD